MRITSGHLRGRLLKVPAGIRPSQDMVRQAVFSTLGPIVSGAKVLDLYAGSGAYGLEAWSRGAASITWVEQDRRHFDALEHNVRTLAGEGNDRRCICADAARHLQTDPDTYDLVFADPPYAETGSAGLLEKTLRALAARPMVRPSGVLVFELDARSAAGPSPGWRLLRDRVYGKTRVLIFQRDDEKSGDISGNL